MSTRSIKFSQSTSQRKRVSNTQKERNESDDVSLFLQCPICGINVIKTFIDDHVEKCLSNQQVMVDAEKQQGNKEISTVKERKSEPLLIPKLTSNKEQTTPENDNRKPLAERVRPSLIDEMQGNDELFHTGSLVRHLLERDPPLSLILTGPPGCGKTTVARIIIAQSKCPSYSFSCCTSSLNDIKSIAEKAESYFKQNGLPTILFLDEIHRFNRKQQDYFLSYVERGIIVLIGATTESPSFSVNEALLSRCRIIVLKALSTTDIYQCIQKAIQKDHLIQDSKIVIDDEAIHMIAEKADGDARMGLNMLESCVRAAMRNEEKRVTLSTIQSCLPRRLVKYDKHDEEHFNIISALHKSIRGSDVQAALYWLTRMLEGGENPLYICRRLIRASTEDIGLSDPYALILTTRCYEVCKELGSPLCNTALTQCVSYLALTSKSNELYLASSQITKLIHESGYLPVPLDKESSHSLLPVDLQSMTFFDVRRAITDLRQPSFERVLHSKTEVEKEDDANLEELPLEKRVKLYIKETP